MQKLTGNERRQVLVNDAALADRSVDKLEQVGIGVVGIQIRSLAGVYDRSTSNGHKDVGLVELGELDRFLETLVGGLGAGAVVDNKGHVASLEGLDHGLHHGQLGNVGVGHDQDFLGLHVGQIHADLASDTLAKAHSGRGHLEGVLMLHVWHGTLLGVMVVVLVVAVSVGMGGAWPCVGLANCACVRVGGAGAGLVHERDQGRDSRSRVLGDPDSSRHFLDFPWCVIGR